MTNPLRCVRLEILRKQARDAELLKVRADLQRFVDTVQFCKNNDRQEPEGTWDRQWAMFFGGMGHDVNRNVPWMPCQHAWTVGPRWVVARKRSNATVGYLAMSRGWQFSSLSVYGPSTSLTVHLQQFGRARRDKQRPVVLEMSLG